ncbi:pyridoxal-phosphate dependent enzyme [Alteromonadaceae bacterium BrNp21-10]|nr:pyridoxal-phosphate dependent enzyme [Alteromonadaceae bacterium BrNp21-10]
MEKLELSGHSLARKLAIQSPSPEQRCDVNWANPNNSQLWVKRDDLLHPIISGNKWRKLKYALAMALSQSTTHIISFGGGYSNHLHALGYCCYQLGIQFTAIVRGNYQQNLTPMLQDLVQWQSDIQYVDKATYQRRNDADYLSSLEQRYPQAQIIAEGGSQHSALQGVAEIISELQQEYDYILLPVASGGTLAGLIQSTNSSQLIGIAVLKGKGYLESLVQQLLNGDQQCQWQILHDFHHGGYAKSSTELSDFCRNFSHFPIESVYSGKLLFAAKQLLAQGYFAANSKVLLIHTGGLQTNRD